MSKYTKAQAYRVTFRHMGSIGKGWVTTVSGEEADIVAELTSYIAFNVYSSLDSWHVVVHLDSLSGCASYNKEGRQLAMFILEPVYPSEAKIELCG